MQTNGAFSAFDYAVKDLRDATVRPISASWIRNRQLMLEGLGPVGEQALQKKTESSRIESPSAQSHKYRKGNEKTGKDIDDKEEELEVHGKFLR